MNNEEEIWKLMQNFLSKMNNWEIYCNEIEDEDLSSEEEESAQRKKVVEIFDSFCTKKERKMGLPNNISYGAEGSFDYSVENEKITSINVETKIRAIVETFKIEPMEEKYKYIVKMVKGRWLIDSKKRFSSYKDTWLNENL